MPSQNIQFSSGFLLINKPFGITSHDVIDALRAILGVKKIGHAGTLDPFATGLLIVGVGREATKQLARFSKLDKEYVCTLYLGKESDTYDRTGRITETAHTPSDISIVDIKRVLGSFIGKIAQVPPMYSAKKVKGRRLYEIARSGKEIERKPCSVTLHALEVLSYAFPLLQLKVHCSSGTYIRSLGHDIGRALGCGAYVESLERMSIGHFSIVQSTTIDLIKETRQKPPFFERVE